MANPAEVLKNLALLCSAFPTFTLKSATNDLYIQLLADIPEQALRQAVLEHISRSTYFPTVAELRQAAFELIEASSPIPNEYEAWSEVEKEIQRCGHYGEPEFSHALIARSVELLGWRYLCLSENPVSDRAQFLKAYAGLVESARKDARRLPEVRGYIAALQGGKRAEGLPEG